MLDESCDCFPSPASRFRHRASLHVPSTVTSWLVTFFCAKSDELAFHDTLCSCEFECSPEPFATHSRATSLRDMAV